MGSKNEIVTSDYKGCQLVAVAAKRCILFFALFLSVFCAKAQKDCGVSGVWLPLKSEFDETGTKEFKQTYSAVNINSKSLLVERFLFLIDIIGEKAPNYTLIIPESIYSKIDKMEYGEDDYRFKGTYCNFSLYKPTDKKSYEEITQIPFAFYHYREEYYFGTYKDDRNEPEDIANRIKIFQALNNGEYVVLTIENGGIFSEPLVSILIHPFKFMGSTDD